MYLTCLRKDIPGNKIERLSKIYAFDNPLQLRANFFPEIEDSSYDYTRIANYDKIEYEAPIPSEKQLTKVSQIKEPDTLDKSTYDLRDWVLLGNYNIAISSFHSP